MTAENPTPDQWTAEQLTELMIYRRSQEYLERAYLQTKRSIQDMRLNLAVGSPDTHDAMRQAIFAMEEVLKALNEDIQRDESRELAYIRIIACHDTTEGAYERALEDIRRMTDESQ